jgi:ubiquinone/menaquinone biosynthesis C-methylase UbiE
MILHKKSRTLSLYSFGSASRRIWASLIVCLFLFNVCFSESVLAKMSSQQPSSFSSEQPYPDDLSTIHLPQGMGKIEDSYLGNAEEYVLLIQDAHAIPEAQRNIRNIIDYFSKFYGLKTIALEGVDQSLEPQFFRSFPNKSLLKKVFKAYLDQGELTGTTMAAIFNEIEADYVGIEDWSLFEEGYSFYLDAQNQTNDLKVKIEVKEKELHEQKKGVYSKEAIHLDGMLQDFRNNEKNIIELIDYLSAIKPSAANSEIDLIVRKQNHSELEEIPIEMEVKKLARVVESGLRRNDATAAGGREVLASFNEKMQAFQLSQISPEEFAVLLKELTAGLGLKITLSRKLEQLMKQHKRLRDIEGTKFYEDLQKYIQEIKEEVFKSADEKALDLQSEQLEVLKKMMQLELTPTAWQDLKNFEGIWSREDNKFKSIRDEMNAHDAFYRNTEERDNVFITQLDKLLAKEEKKISLSGNSKKVIAFVSGGFHSHNLRERLRENKTSYLLISPSIQSLPEENNYKKHMQGQVSWTAYFEPKEGRVNIADAFARYTRDQLMKSEDVDHGLLMKQWRDQILRDLAAKKEMTQASRYTKYFDESVSNSEKSDSLIQKIKEFSDRLRNLENQGLLTQQNVLNIMKPSMMTSSATYLALAGNKFVSLQPNRAELRAHSTPNVRTDQEITDAYSGFGGKPKGRIFDKADGRFYSYDLSALVLELEQSKKSSGFLSPFRKNQEAKILSFWKSSMRSAIQVLLDEDSEANEESDIHVLELGSGDGTLMGQLSDEFTSSFTGIDFDPKFVEVANEKYASERVSFFQGDATNLEDIANESMNIVILNEGLGNLPLFQEQADAKTTEPKRQTVAHPIFDEAYRTLKPGGFVIIHDFDEKESDQITQLAGYLNYPIKDRVRALENAGFKIISSDHLTTSLAQLPQTHTIIARKSQRSELRVDGNPFQTPISVPTDKDLREWQETIERDWGKGRQGTLDFKKLFENDFFELVGFQDGVALFDYGQEKEGGLHVKRYAALLESKVFATLSKLNDEIRKKEKTIMDSLMNPLMVTLLFSGPVALVVASLTALIFFNIQIKRTPEIMFSSFGIVHAISFVIHRIWFRNHRTEKIRSQSKTILTELLALATSSRDVSSEYALPFEEDPRSELRQTDGDAGWFQHFFNIGRREKKYDIQLTYFGERRWTALRAKDGLSHKYQVQTLGTDIPDHLFEDYVKMLEEYGVDDDDLSGYAREQLEGDSEFHFLVNQQTGRAIGFYNMSQDRGLRDPNQISYVMNLIFITNTHRGTGAADVLYEDMIETYFEGDREAKFWGSIARDHKRAKGAGGEFQLMTTSQRKEALGIMSKVTVVNSLSELRAVDDADLILLERGESSREILFNRQSRNEEGTLILLYPRNSKGENAIHIFRAANDSNRMILSYLDKEGNEQSYPIDVSKTFDVKLGRDHQQNLSPKYSRNHAKLSFRRNSDGFIVLVITDMNSTNKTAIKIEREGVPASRVLSEASTHASEANLVTMLQPKVIEQGASFWISNENRRTYVVVEKKDSNIILHLYHFENNKIAGAETKTLPFDFKNPTYTFGRRSPESESHGFKIDKDYVSRSHGYFSIETTTDGKIKHLKVFDGEHLASGENNRSTNGLYTESLKRVGGVPGKVNDSSRDEPQGVLLTANRIHIQPLEIADQDALYDFKDRGLRIYYQGKTQSYFALEMHEDPRESLGMAMLPGQLLHFDATLIDLSHENLSDPTQRIFGRPTHIQTKIKLNEDGTLMLESDVDDANGGINRLVLTHPLNKDFFPKSAFITRVTEELLAKARSFGRNEIEKYLAEQTEVQSMKSENNERGLHGFCDSTD